MASWSYWTSFAQEKWGQKNRFSVLRMNTQGDNNNESYGDIQNGGTITDNSNLLGTRQLRPLIRPGYSIDHITNKEENLDQLLGSAYLSPDGKRIVLVYVNMMASQNSVRI